MYDLVVPVVADVDLIPTIAGLHELPLVRLDVGRSVHHTAIADDLERINKKLALASKKLSTAVHYTFYKKTHQTVPLAGFRQFEVRVLDLDHRAEKIFLELVSCE